MENLNIEYEPFNATELCKIMGEYGSDKGHINISTSPHNYTTLYYQLFKDIRNNKLRIFELGLGTNNLDVLSNMGKDGKPGASLKGWRDFFPNAEVFGADIDKRILFSDTRIQTYYCDQTNPDVIKNMYENTPELVENFDIIIEDGWHTFPAQVCFFENSIHKLKNGGTYIIEDVHNNLLNESIYYYNKINEWKINYPNLKFWICRLPSKLGAIANNLIIIQK